MKAPHLRTLTLRDRLAGLTARERAFLAAGAICLALFMLYVLLWRVADDDGPVELVTTASPPPIPVAIAPPPPLPVVTAPPVQAAAASVMILQGVSGGGPGGGAALVQYQDGTQRLVRVGREIAPGMTLKSIGPTWVIAGSGSGDVRLDLNRPGMAPVVVAPPPPR